MYLPDRYYPAMRIEPRFVEALLLPFHDHGKVVGTVWILSHDFERKFDGEDERVARTLTDFASAGWQLWKAGERAAELNHAKDEFIAVLSHELRGPLAAISLIEQTFGRLPYQEDTFRRCLERLRRQTVSITQIVEDIGDLSGLSHRKLALRREPLEISQLLKDLLEDFEERLSKAQLSARLTLPESRIRVLGDRVRLTQVFNNLLSNAIKFTAPGDAIEVQIQADDRTITMQIRDNGCGFDPALGETIFTPFMQNSAVTRGAQKGLGLGLAICRQLVELHEGKISANSMGPGHGAVFTVTLPRVLG